MQTYRQMLTELAPDAVFARQEGVSYPTFQKYTYYSRTAHRDTPVNVLLPTDYDEQRTYPSCTFSTATGTRRTGWRAMQSD